MTEETSCPGTIKALQLQKGIDALQVEIDTRARIGHLASSSPAPFYVHAVSPALTGHEDAGCI